MGGLVGVLEVMGGLHAWLLQHCRASSLQDPEQLWVNAAHLNIPTSDTLIN